jgi:hypothetical protein
MRAACFNGLLWGDDAVRQCDAWALAASIQRLEVALRDTLACHTASLAHAGIDRNPLDALDDTAGDIIWQGLAKEAQHGT